METVGSNNPLMRMHNCNSCGELTEGEAQDGVIFCNKCTGSPMVEPELTKEYGEGRTAYINGLTHYCCPYDKNKDYNRHSRWSKGWFDTQKESMRDIKPANPNDIQVGGDHYKGEAIQPWDFIISNELGFLEGNVIKYVTRWKKKDGLKDLEKARHYLDKLISVTKENHANSK